MVVKRVVIIASIGVLASAAALFFSAEKLVSSLLPDKKLQQANIQQDVNKIQATPKTVQVPKYDLYSTSIYDLPFVSIMEISKLPKKIKNEVDSILNSAQGFYFLKYNEKENKIFIILQNPINEVNSYSRHNLEFVELAFNELGEITSKAIYSPVYNGNPDEVSNSIISNGEQWSLDEDFEPARPIKHTVYDEKGKTRFVERWNYDENEEIKYIMKDSKRKVISLLKETLEGDSTYRREHVLYDKSGNIVMHVSANYDGANVSRFMFYDSFNFDRSINIVSEFDSGLKVKETIYDHNYKKIYTFKMNYKNAERKSLECFDSEERLIKKIES